MFGFARHPTGAGDAYSVRDADEFSFVSHRTSAGWFSCLDMVLASVGSLPVCAVKMPAWMAIYKGGIRRVLGDVFFASIKKPLETRMAIGFALFSA